jgi:antitoxin YefM
MSTVYRLKASELNRDFLEEIKATFGDKEIEIIVSQFDETAYLLKSEVNKNRLLRAIENVKERQNLVEVSLPDWLSRMLGVKSSI